MTEHKRYKRVGWAVQTKHDGATVWFTTYWSYALTRTKAIRNYERIAGEGMYSILKRDKKRDARCVPLYVEAE